MSQIINDPNGGINSGGYFPQSKPDSKTMFTQPENCGVVGCWGTDSQGRKTLNGKLYEPKANSNEVTCADGTKDVSNGAKAPCTQNGGVNPTPTSTQGSNTKEPIYYILVTAGVLVLGYFAYKKFKK